MLGRLVVILAPATSVPRIPTSSCSPVATRVTSSWEFAPIEHPTATALVAVLLRGMGPPGQRRRALLTLPGEPNRSVRGEKSKQVRARVAGRLVDLHVRPRVRAEVGAPDRAVSLRPEEEDQAALMTIHQDPPRGGRRPGGGGRPPRGKHDKDARGNQERWAPPRQSRLGSDIGGA